VFFSLAILLINTFSGTAYALSQSQKDSLRSGALYFNTEIDGTIQCDTTPATAQTGSVYFIGDSIGTQVQSGLSSNFGNKGFKASAVSGRTLAQGIAAVDSDATFIKTASVAIVELGTNSTGMTAGNITQMVDKLKSLNPSITIYWVDTAVVVRADYAVTLSKVNDIIYSQSTGSYSVISWNKAVFGASADPTNIDPNAPDNGYIRRADQYVHLTDKGIDAMIKLISSSVSSEGSLSAAGLNCACTDGSSSLTGSANAEKAWNYFISKGLSPIQTAAILGNFNQESGINPRRVQNTQSPEGDSDINPLDGVTGYGIAQWTNLDRQKNLSKYAADTNRAVSDLGLQLDFTIKEMTDSSPNDVWDSLLTKNTIESATRYFHDSFEGSADNASGIQERIDDASAFLAKYGSGQAGTDSGTTTAIGCGSTDSAAGSQIVGDIGLNSNNIACAAGTKDLGVVTTKYTGSYKKESGPLIIRLCQVPDVPGAGDNASGALISGGVVVNSRVSGAWRALGLAAKAANISLYGTSSFRLDDSCGGTGDGGACATPGGSPHQMGVAIDFYNQMYAIDTSRQSCSVRVTKLDSPQWRWMYLNAEKYGFEQYSAEAWHWDPIPSTNRCNSNEPSGLV
jgi:hypothetical protein